MSSILTNNSAMVALQTLQGINKNLAMTQSEISTGKSIASARDNSAIWAISQVMESDVAGFSAISDSLSLGSSTVAVARNASEQITDLLNQVKEKVVAAQEDNVDRGKIQTDIEALRDQITSIVDAAQFNGSNLLKAGDDLSILSSLDRNSNGVVADRSISVGRNDLQATAATFGATAFADDATRNGYFSLTDGAGGAQATGTFTTDSTTPGTTDAAVITVAGAGAPEEGVSYRITLQGVAGNDFGTDAVNFDYVARAGDDETDIAAALYDQVNNYVNSNELADVGVSLGGAGNNEITITNLDPNAANDLVVTRAVTDDGDAGGGLASLGAMDVSTASGAAQALSDVEGLIQSAIDAAAEFGSAQGRVDIQADFISSLTNSLKSGIGGLIDADMEEASARLQALQVQQQLGIQSLSIANQAPQNILSLFR